MLEKLRRKIEDIRWEDAAEISWWVKFARRQVRLYFYILREMLRDRCPQQAAALTYTTLLSLVPLLAVAFAFFRGFAAMEGLQERAQDAIFRSVLATPLVEGMWQGDEAGAALQPEMAALEPAQLLAAADERAASGEHAAALALYVAGLNAGAEPGAVRSGISQLPLARLPVREVLERAASEARQQYHAAAGIPEREETAGADASHMEARKLYRQGQEAAAQDDLAAARELLRRAESSGYSPGAVRLALADVFASQAEAMRQGGEMDEAADSYRTALLHYGDAVVMAAWRGRADEMQPALDGHRDCRAAFGEMQLEVGRQGTALYRSLRQQAAPPQAVQTALQTALADLQAAASLVADSAEIHRMRAQLLWEAGRQELARQAYETALQQTEAGAARGLSVAVVDYIREFIDKVGRAEIGVLGAAFLLVTATSLLSTIEKTLNHIWKVQQKRPFWIKFTSYWTLICLGPVLIAMGLLAQERLGYFVVSSLGDLPGIRHVVGVLGAAVEIALPFLTMWLVLLALYKFLPHTRVKLSSVAWGAFVATLLLTLARPLFSMYVAGAIGYEKIYGSLGAVPIFLLWVWLLWLIVLFGAEVSFTIQNVSLLRYRDKLRRLSNLFVDRYLAARIMMYVAREFWETGEPVSATQLADILQISNEEAADAAGRLVGLNLLTPVGEERDEFHPARDLSRLKLSEVLSIMDRFRDESRSGRPENRCYEEQLETAFRAAIVAQEEALDEMTFRDLLLACEGEKGKYPKGNGQPEH